MGVESQSTALGGAAQATDRKATPGLVVRSFPLIAHEWRRFLAFSLLIVVDWCAVLASLGLAWGLRSGPLHGLWAGYGPVYPFGTYVRNLYFLLPWAVMFAESGLYTRRSLFWDEVQQVVRACTLAALLAVALTFTARPVEELSRIVVAGTWLTTLFVVPFLRFNAKRALVAAGLWSKRVLILGAGETGGRVLEHIRLNRSLGYEPVALVDDDPRKIGGVQAGLPIRGPLSSVTELIAELGIKDVVVAMPRLSRERLLHVISTCEGHVESIRVVPDMFGLATAGVATEDLDGMLLLNMRWNLAKPWNMALKRSFDLIVGTLALILFAPLLLLVALAIRLDSPGPILFVQQRLGYRWQRFRCIKFRTMYTDNERRLREYLVQHPEARTEWERYAKLRSFDPRVTRTGRLLRRFSLDELPQLFNVLSGNMSLVGPRPYLLAEVPRMGDFTETILKAQPGLTGLWQVSRRNELTFDERLRLDEYYVRNWSLWLDAVVLVKTVDAVLRWRGAY